MTTDQPTFEGPLLKERKLPGTHLSSLRPRHSPGRLFIPMPAPRQLGMDRLRASGLQGQIGVLRLLLCQPNPGAGPPRPPHHDAEEHRARYATRHHTRRAPGHGQTHTGAEPALQKPGGSPTTATRGRLTTHQHGRSVPALEGSQWPIVLHSPGSHMLRAISPQD